MAYWEVWEKLTLNKPVTLQRQRKWTQRNSPQAQVVPEGVDSSWTTRVWCLRFHNGIQRQDVHLMKRSLWNLVAWRGWKLVRKWHSVKVPPKTVAFHLCFFPQMWLQCLLESRHLRELLFSRRSARTCVCFFKRLFAKQNKTNPPQKNVKWGIFERRRLKQLINVYCESSQHLYRLSCFILRVFNISFLLPKGRKSLLFCFFASFIISCFHCFHLALQFVSIVSPKKEEPPPPPPQPK